MLLTLGGVAPSTGLLHYALNWGPSSHAGPLSPTIAVHHIVVHPSNYLLNHILPQRLQAPGSACSSRPAFRRLPNKDRRLGPARGPWLPGRPGAIRPECARSGPWPPAAGAGGTRRTGGPAPLPLTRCPVARDGTPRVCGSGRDRCLRRRQPPRSVPERSLRRCARHAPPGTVRAPPPIRSRW